MPDSLDTSASLSAIGASGWEVVVAIVRTSKVKSVLPSSPKEASHIDY